MQTKTTGEYGSQTIEFYHEHGRAVATELPDFTMGVFIHGANVDYEHRRKGLGRQYHRERLEWLSKNHYKVALCAVFDWNEAEKKIMFAESWNMVSHGFFNVYSKNL